MLSRTDIDRFGGAVLLLLVTTSIAGAAFASGVGTDYNVAPEEVPEVLRLVAENQSLHMAEIGFDLASWVLTVTLAGALYLAYGPHHRQLALLGTLGLAAGGIILALHDIPWFVLPSVAQEFILASGTRADTLQDTGRVIMQTANFGLSVGITFLGLGIVAYGILIVRSGAAPRGIGWLGVAAGILAATSVWLPRFDEDLYVVFVVLASPVLLWQLGLGVWLLLRGTEDRS